MKPLLSVRRVHARHSLGDVEALRDVSLDVVPGEILALVGPNGSGKSTLLSVMGRDLKASAGTVSLGGVAIADIPRRKFSRCVARLPQDPATPEGVTVERLVGFGRHPHRRSAGRSHPADLNVVQRALTDVGLATHRKRPLETLSGGERRRAWLAMILAQQPELMLLDEPTAALDLRHQWELLQLVRELNRERGTTVVLSLHDLEHSIAIADRVAVLLRGRIYDIGAPENVVTSEALLDVFRIRATIDADSNHGRIRVLGPGDPVRSF